MIHLRIDSDVSQVIEALPEVTKVASAVVGGMQNFENYLNIFVALYCGCGGYNALYM